MKTQEETLNDFTVAMLQIMETANVMGLEKRMGTVIKTVIQEEHRTVQQSFVRTVLIPMIKTMSEQNTDLRNQGAVTLCQDLMEVVEKANLPFI